MIELTLISFLSLVGVNFCDYRKEDHNNNVSILLAYSDASEMWGVQDVKKLVMDTENIDTKAYVFIKNICPQHLEKKKIDIEK